MIFLFLFYFNFSAFACDLICPPEMVPVCGGASPFCVDRFEYGSTAFDGKPLGYMNKATCERVCGMQGKRLLTHSEWLIACAGTPRKACNIYRNNPVIRMYQMPGPWMSQGLDCKRGENRWRFQCMNDPRLNQLNNGLAANGEFSECVSSVGAYNMVGNLGEWVNDPNGTFNGGLYPMPRSSCGYTTIAHGPEYSDYSIGCRCGMTISN